VLFAEAGKLVKDNEVPAIKVIAASLMELEDKFIIFLPYSYVYSLMFTSVFVIQIPDSVLIKFVKTKIGQW
jgi:hypothetical protein